jgi:hypothetical protein
MEIDRASNYLTVSPFQGPGNAAFHSGAVWKPEIQGRQNTSFHRFTSVSTPKLYQYLLTFAPVTAFLTDPFFLDLHHE